MLYQINLIAIVIFPVVANINFQTILLYANGKTILSVSSHDDSFKNEKNNPKEIAFKVGEKLGELIKEKKIKDNFTFDRGGYLYHGRIKELAMGIRSKGIKF